MLHAGLYPDNIVSRKMLERCGYVPFPDGNVAEKHYITGEDIVQLDYIYNSVTIRLATPSDALEMAEIHMRSCEAIYKSFMLNEYIEKQNAKRPALWQKIITDENKTQYIIQQSGKTVGIMCVVAQPQDNDAGDEVSELEGIYLHPNYYRQGIGTVVMEFAYKIARSYEKTAMILWVFAENVSSINFYKKCGFAADGKTKVLICGKPLIAIRMRKNL